jgi:hypothetical protein
VTEVPQTCGTWVTEAPAAEKLGFRASKLTEVKMAVERMIRIFAGCMVLASLALGLWVNQNFFWLTAFVGANLLQSGFTRLCPLESILRRRGAHA